jgi:hypothetical protein
MKTLTPGVIPRSEFIHWHSISQKLDRLQAGIQFYADLADRVHAGADFVRELADSLLASDDPLPLVECAFELLGHTNPEFVTKEDDLHTVSLGQSIVNKDEGRALYFANLLKDLGFPSILARDDLEDLMLGVQIGLETHRRKNIGGEAFKDEVVALLDRITADFRESGSPVRVEQEITISYGQGLSKKVDFALLLNDVIRFGVEANFYTVSGSKPTEIKRSYGDLLRGLQSVNIDLIWVTDGKGYRQMLRSLRDAYVILPNIYNLKQTQQHLLSDLKSILQR